jgi:beta-hydroxyacyl-ACP dehydratase FabZ
MTAERIRELLPHREPFLFVDGVTKLEDNHIEAFHDVRPDAFFFQGHFPGNPVFPGVLMVEAIAQTGILLVLAKRTERQGRSTLFAGIESVRFRRIVRPGERAVMNARVAGERKGVYKIEGVMTVNGETACEATVWGALR